MRLRLIACDTLRREISHLVPKSQHQIDLDWLPIGTQEAPDSARRALQEKIDNFEPNEYDGILLGYCLCNTFIAGLTTPHTPLVVPRVYDHTDLYLGSRQRHKESFEKEPGTFYFTSGRVEAWDSSQGHSAWTQSHRLLRQRTYENMVKEYGADNAKTMIDTVKDWSCPFFCGCFIKTGLEGDEEARLKAQQICSEDGWRFEEVEGDLGLLQRWLCGPWAPEEFLIVKPGQRVIETFDETVYATKTYLSVPQSPSSEETAADTQAPAVAPTAEGAPPEPAGRGSPPTEERQPSDPLRAALPPCEDGEVDTSLNIEDLLRNLVERGGSDLHIKAGQPPVIRVHGHLFRLDHQPMTPATTKALMYSLMNEERIRSYEKDLEMDLAHSIPGVARFRVNILRQRQNVGGVMRQIPINIKTIDEMGLPQVLKDLSLRPRGLILVTGPTGSGKSTTLASCIDHINLNRRAHIVTIEDPIEFVHADKKAILEQRELGQDTHSFADALKHVMRQAPDVILVGEMRDLETISLAITAAETGHLVFGTLHTTDAAQTIDRIIDVFPPEQQEQIRAQLAITLEAVVSQSLLPLKGKQGRMPAFEIMVCTPAIRALIREAKTHQMYTIIQSSADLGMISLDQSLLNILQEDTVTWEDALAKTSNPVDFVERAKRMGLAPEQVGGEKIEIQNG